MPDRGRHKRLDSNRTHQHWVEYQLQ